jgi:glycosyltransferase involved in cell wall biosynthesis
VKVLFVSSGNAGHVNPLIKAQGESIEKEGVVVEYFLIKGKGNLGYLSNIKRLRKQLKESQYDVVHAHYSFSGYVAALAGANPLVISLMGSDVNSSRLSKYLIHFFSKTFWKKILVKSEDMKIKIGLNRALVIPNGVDTSVFKPMDKHDCQNDLKWNSSARHILFAANPERQEKNFKLFKSSYEALITETNELIEFHVLGGVPHHLIPIYMNASDLVCLTSKWEGSPNVIKEALACCRPIVSTDVGDVRLLTDGIDGCFVTERDVDFYKEAIKSALNFRKNASRTTGFEKIQQLEIDSVSIAKKLIDQYKKLLSGSSK